jgi:hypothetical protein
MRNYADALRPRQLPIAKPNTRSTTKRPDTTTRNAHASKNNTQYDDEQCAIYHQNYIEETLNDIRKRLYQRSQPARTLRHRQQIGEGNAATKEAKGRTSDGDTDHHLRDGATARTKDQGRQEEE